MKELCENVFRQETVERRNPLLKTKNVKDVNWFCLVYFEPQFPSASSLVHCRRKIVKGYKVNQNNVFLCSLL